MDIYEIRAAINSGKTIYDLPLTVTYYARVSTDKDAQLHSLTAQVHYYTELIQNCPQWNFAEGYVDEGISGTSVGKREQFLRMIADAKAGRFDFVITKEISRFSRNTLDSIRYTQELLRCGVGVLFQSDNINTLMPDAELRLTIMSSIAQDEVRKISERVKFGFKRAVENGVVLGNSNLWGYQKQDGALVIDEREAEMVRMVFDLYSNQNMGIRAISERLAEAGWVSRGGKALSFSTIRNILSNPKYKGYYCGRKSCKYDYKLNDRKWFQPEEWVVYKDETRVPPIVSEQLWEKANRILSQRSKGRSEPQNRGAPNKYPFSSKVLCAVHSKPYYRALYKYSGGEKEVWRCCEYVTKGRAGCDLPPVYTQELNQIVGRHVDERLGDKLLLARKMVRTYTQLAKKGWETGGAARCRSMIEDIVRRKDRLLDLNIKGQISDQEFVVRNQQFNNEMKKQEERLASLEREAEQEQNTVQSFETLFQEIQTELNFPEGYSAQVIHELVDHIEIQTQTDSHFILAVLYLRGSSQPRCYQIKRRRGKPSVCFEHYI